MRDRIDAVIRKLKHRCDYLEVRIEEFVLTQITIRGPKVETLSESIELGGCVRAYHKGGMGFVSFNDLDRIEEYAQYVLATLTQGRVDKPSYRLETATNRHKV